MTAEPVFYVNGEWTPASRATIHIFDSGLMYGDTVTETLRTFHRIPFQPERHLARLRDSLRLARIEVNPSVNIGRLVEEIVERNRDVFDPDDELLIKVDVTHGVFDYYREPKTHYDDFHVMLHVLQLPFWKFAHQYELGFSVVYPSARQPPAQTLDPRIKHRSRMYQAIAERQAAEIRNGAQALLLDTDGRVAEGTGWNVFLVKDGTVHTPSTENCLGAISRAMVLEMCCSLGLPVQEGVLWPYDLVTADEVFATATSYCLPPITRVESFVVGDGRRGSVASQLLNAWSE